MLEPLERLVDTRTASLLLGISASKLARWRGKCVGPPYVRFDDGTIRYKLSDLNTWVRALRHHWRPRNDHPWKGLSDAELDTIIDSWQTKESRSK